MRVFSRSPILLSFCGQSGRVRTADALERTNVAYPFIFSPWTFEEYVLAVQDDEFWNQVQARLCENRKLSFVPPNVFMLSLSYPVVSPSIKSDDRLAVVTHKFFWAGHSARLMFDLTISQVERFLTQKLRSISDSDIFLNLRLGPESPTAVNSLMVQLEDKRSHTSPFVTQQLLKGFPQYRDQLNKIQQISENHFCHSVLQGWLFQLRIEILFRNAEKIQYYCRDSSSVIRSWCPTRCFSFDNQEKELLSKQIEIVDLIQRNNPVVILPNCPSFPVYDFMILQHAAAAASTSSLIPLRLTLINATVAYRKQIKWEHTVSGTVRFLTSLKFEIIPAEFEYIALLETNHDVALSHHRAESPFDASHSKIAVFVPQTL
jgi:hypothetical protein